MRPIRLLGVCSALFVSVAWAGVLVSSATSSLPASAQNAGRKLPAPPANGELGFVVESFAPAFLPDPEACPTGPALKTRDIFLQSLPAGERARLLDPANQVELDERWQASLRRPDGANICTNPDMFDRPMLKTVQSRRGPGLDLDGDGQVKSCQHQEFVSPTGEQGIDNQAYRALGCKLEWYGKDGQGGDILAGWRQYLASGQWTQVILLRGVDSLERDDDVDVVYANSPDRPTTDSEGNFLPGVSFNISDKPPRHRNVMKGRIVAGVLTTQPADVALTQTYGQGGPREIRGARSKFDLRNARLKLTFQPDGSLRGLIGGYQPVFDLIQSISFGGGLRTGIDCAGELKTLKTLADGIPDPRTGQCTAVSSAYTVSAVPAFVHDPKAQVLSSKISM